MFEPQGLPRLFGVPVGVNFARAVHRGMVSRLKNEPPEAMARVTVFVNTQRMRRALLDIFDEETASFVPHIVVINQLDHLPEAAGLPRATPKLELKLKLTAVLSDLLERLPGMATSTNVLDLADSLATLFDEMQGEGVGIEALNNLETLDHAGHWQISLNIISALEKFYGGDLEPGAEARLRKITQAIVENWSLNKPNNPILVVGSTGSRGTTRLLMRAVSGLPQGAIILPGVDFDQPRQVWSEIKDPLTAEDHPQFRFRQIADEVGVSPTDIERWIPDKPFNPDRARLISLALRPAPVTDHWITEGKAFEGLDEATADIALLCPATQREEALAIAVILRDCLDRNKSAALVTPDRTLGRRVTTALKRWGIVPDDSVGQPLHLTAAGRFLTHVMDASDERTTLLQLLIILKHPISASSPDIRGPHLIHTRDLELFLRRESIEFPDSETILDWSQKKTEETQVWAKWVSDCLIKLSGAKPKPLSKHIKKLVETSEYLAAGPMQQGSGVLWEEEAGKKTRKIINDLVNISETQLLSGFEARSIFVGELASEEVRPVAVPHAQIRILGTLEARAQDADLVVLAGLNEGVWPKTPEPDPWMNRQMRLKTGLLLPERQIGLAAHDFQQAACASEVVFSRCLRDNDAETVPSRWLSRLMNLISGIGEQGKIIAQDMKLRGDAWLDIVSTLDTPTVPLPASPRPSPSPPASMRPKELPVTSIKTLIRDPYAIYAARVLGLRTLPGFAPQPDALLRGNLYHKIMERCLTVHFDPNLPETLVNIANAAEEELAQTVPWPYVQRQWLGQIKAILPKLIAAEIERFKEGHIFLTETKGALRVGESDFVLNARLDRLDRAPSGAITIYDYKSGKPPTPKEAEYFDKQLLLEAAMLDRGGFESVLGQKTDRVAYLGLSDDMIVQELKLETDEGWLPDLTWEKFCKLIDRYLSGQVGYTSLRAIQLEKHVGDFDHLARFGEWDLSTPPTKEALSL